MLRYVARAIWYYCVSFKVSRPHLYIMYITAIVYCPRCERIAVR